MFFLRRWLIRPIHVSILIGWLSVGVIIGVILGLVTKGYFADGSWLALGLVLLGVVVLYKRTWLTIVIMISGILIGLWRSDMETIRLQSYQKYHNQTIVLSGVIAEDTDLSKRGDTQIQLRQVVIDGESLSGTVWVGTDTQANVKRSDVINVKGKLQPGFGSFAASINRAQLIKVQHTVEQARDIRDQFANGVRSAISEPEASLGIGYVVGQSSDSMSELEANMRLIGLTHIIVASGYNLTVLIRFAKRLFSKVSKYLTVLFGGILIVSFMFITGQSPSMSRAGLVAGLSLAAWYYGRKISPFILLPLVAAITVLFNPSYLWGDIGWYLSFSAFAGVMILAPLFQHYFFGPEKPGWLTQTLGETLAALVMTTPIILLVFSTYSIYALIANILVVPLIPFVMGFTFIAGLTGLVAPYITPIMGFPAFILLSYTTTIIDIISGLPHVSGELTITAGHAFLWYLMVIVIGFHMWRRTRHDFRGDNLID